MKTLLNYTNIFKQDFLHNFMVQTAALEVEYGGRKIPYQTPLGIYLDRKITGRIHDAIIPKYNEITP